MTNDLIRQLDSFAADFPEQPERVNGRDWGVIRTGSSGPALLLLPGTLGRADIFWNQISALRDRTRILALSYPSSGGIPDWGLDICALMDQHGLASATVLGSSLGGYVAQYMAGVHADRMDNLIAANTLHAVDFITLFPPYSADLDTIATGTLMDGFNSGMESWRAKQPERSDLVDLLLREINGRIPEAELRNRLIALKTGPDLPPARLSKSQIFTVESDDDHLIAQPISDLVRARLNPASTEVFVNGTHFPYITQPDKYVAMLVRILG